VQQLLIPKIVVFRYIHGAQTGAGVRS